MKTEDLCWNGMEGPGMIFVGIQAIDLRSQVGLNLQLEHRFL